MSDENPMGPRIALLIFVLVILANLIAKSAFGDERDGGVPEAPVCVCVEGKPALEIIRLRAEVRLLRAAAMVNRKAEEKAAKRAVKP